MNLFDPSPRLKKDDFHPYFTRITTDESYKPVLKVLQDWSIGLMNEKTGRTKESKKFIDEFQTTFHSSFWELYLNKAFIDLGFSIDYSKTSPDFHLTHLHSGEIINVEAVTTNNSKNRDKGYYDNILSDSIETHEDFLNQSTIKLIGKLKDKLALYLGTGNKKHPYATLAHVKNKPFVIAVAPFDSHFSFGQNNVAINRVLYGIEPPKFNHLGNPVEKIDHIINNNRSRIDLGIFTNDSYKEISAVIFSTTGTWGKAIIQSGIGCKVCARRYREQRLTDFIKYDNWREYNKSGIKETKLSETHNVSSKRYLIDNLVFGVDMHLCDSTEYNETHLDGLHIYYNPYAEIPLNPDMFRFDEITHNSYDIKTESMIAKHNDGSLIGRIVITTLKE